MTILPKKKEQKSDEVERNRSRNRATRSGDVVRNRNNQEENISENSNSLDKRDSQEVINLPPHKRSRHRQNTNYFSKNNRESREGSVSPTYDVNENGYNSSDEYGSRREVKKVKRRSFLVYIQETSLFYFIDNLAATIISNKSKYFYF